MKVLQKMNIYIDVIENTPLIKQHVYIDENKGEASMKIISKR